MAETAHGLHPCGPSQFTHRSQEIDMSTTEAQTTSPDPRIDKVDMKLEIHVIPVSDVDRSKQFYERLGWRLDDDAAPLEGLRIVQFTPPGSGTSITFGKGLTSAAPGSSAGGARRLRHRSGPWRARRPRHRRERRVARPAVPPRGPATRRRPRAHQLWVVLLRQRSRRQRVAGPGGHHAAPRPGRRRRNGVRVQGRSGGCASACRGRPRRARGARAQRDEDWPAWYASYMVAEQAGTDLPT